VRRQGGRGKMAGEHPYPTVVLLRWLAEEKRRRSGGAIGSRSSAMAGKLRALGFLSEGGGCGLGRDARAQGALK
jgi:hypothetical protein